MNRQNSNVSFHLAGFTLIELVMVIVLIGILSAVAIINNPFNSIKLNRSVTKVIADIRYVQKLAISLGPRTSPLQLAGMTFSGSGYTVYSTMTSTIAKSPGDSCSDDGSGSFVVNFNSPQCSNYSSIGVAGATIYFNSIGKPVTSTGGDISGNQTITISLSGTGSQDITIEEGTGRVH